MYINPNKDNRHFISCAQARYIIPRPSEFLILH